MKFLGGFLLLAALAEGRRVQIQTKSPVEKVVNLLKDLKDKIEVDAKTEQQTYDKFACWCEKITKSKADAITSAQEELRALGQIMLTTKGKIATLTAEIAELAANIKKNKEAQEKAFNIRSKENAAFEGETAEMKQTMNALERAIIVLKDGTSLLQHGSAARLALEAAVQQIPLSAATKPEQLAMLSELVSGSTSYAPQSASVQGILGNMYATFAADLQSASKDEAAKSREYETFIHDKTEQLNSMETEKEEKEVEKAEAETLLADKSQTFDDTAQQKDADIKFFDETKESCMSKHDAWVTRSELRDEEMEGILKALEILTSDDARALFASSIKAGKEVKADDSYDTGVDIAPSMLQLDSGSTTSAFSVLKKVATESKSFRLAALAVRVHEAKVGHFDEVIAEIDTMMKTLADENAADIKKRDQCKSEYTKIASTIGDLEWKIKKNIAKIDKLMNLIEDLKAEKEDTINKIKEVNKTMDEMTAVRTEENDEFLAAKKDDQDAIALIMEARSALSSYYKKNSVDMGPTQGSTKGLELNQQPEFEVGAEQAPDATFSGKGKRKDESKGIVQLMTMIIEDLNDEIKNSMKAEEARQIDYEKQMDAALKLREDLVAKKINLSDQIAKRTEEKDDEEADKQTNEDDLKDEKDYKAKITPDCDWIIKNFYPRSDARNAEMAGLRTAKEYLAGYKPSLLQKRPSLSEINFAGLTK